MQHEVYIDTCVMPEGIASQLCSVVVEIAFQGELNIDTVINQSKVNLASHSMMQCIMS